MSKVKFSDVEELDKVFRNQNNEFGHLVDDFIMIAGMSEEEANQAASNLLDYDGI